MWGNSWDYSLSFRNKKKLREERKPLEMGFEVLLKADTKIKVNQRLGLVVNWSCQVSSASRCFEAASLEPRITLKPSARVQLTNHSTIGMLQPDVAGTLCRTQPLDPSAFASPMYTPNRFPITDFA
jgi:hypothetical protein